MKRSYVFIIILLAVIIGISGTWILSKVFQTEKDDWVEAAVWYGSQTDYNMTTQEFEITGNQWAIRWDCRQVMDDSYFEIIVHDAYTNDTIRDIRSSPNQTLSGENYLTMKGKFYLQIFIRGDLGNWWVRIYETT